PRHQGTACRRRFDHAAGARRQHQCTLDYDRREMRRDGAGRHARRLIAGAGKHSRSTIVAASIDTYDFIVTGAGSAGCAVAGRLSESGKYRVLLLEAGIKDSNPWIHVPLGYTKTFTDPRVNWMFDSEPEPGLNGRVLYQPRGKVLGGTSSINGMVYM